MAGRFTPASGMVSIYVLIDPRDGAIRYVGQTARALDKRLLHHLVEMQETHHRARWLQKLARLGFVPYIELVQKVPSAFWVEAERYWIAYFRAIGCDLVNATDGGDGSLGYTHSDAVRQKMRVIHATRSQEERSEIISKGWAKRKTTIVSDETRSRISAAGKGRVFSAEHRAKIGANTRSKLLGRSLSAEHKASLRKARKLVPSRPHTDETRAKLAEIARRRWVAKRNSA